MYNHILIEKKWKKYWEENQTYKFVNNSKKPKFYVLDMFPYPSGSGLHVGHPKGYIATDILARFKRMNNFNVLHPIGWDAFGLPAEQYAINTNNHPEAFTKKNINIFRKQLKNLGFSYDYQKEINTTDPKFYKWTQWIFTKLYESGLAEIKDIEVNWCEELKTVLANEEVLTDSNGNKVSERGGFLVVKKSMKQWVLKITEYADKLLDGLFELNWTDGLKNIQSTWIGKSIGADIKFKIFNSDNDFIEIFTSRPDTIFGVSFIGLSCDHNFIKKVLIENKDEKLQKLVFDLKQEKEFERNKLLKDPIGYFTNHYAICPFSNKKIPIYLVDYVLNHYGNGAIMGVPFADKRDYYFALKNNLEIIKIIDVNKDFFEDDGIHINSSFLNGLNTKDAIEKIFDELIKLKIGNKKINYKLRDWIFSRQRYWGEPFPILFDENNNIFVETNLPLLLPKTKNFKMSDDGKPPLANLTKWVNIKKNGIQLFRETNTMPQWAGSCWYYLAYILKEKDDIIPLNSQKAFKLFERWLPVDIYIGGQEHAVLHLLYARFWHRFLYDIKIVPTKEPFLKVVNQGMILGNNNEKMSKSKGNVISPDEIINKYGADTLRIYEMFMGPINASLPWSNDGLSGIHKWIQRVWRLFENNKININNKNDDSLESSYNLFLTKATKTINNLEYNLTISEMMIFINECYKSTNIKKKYLIGFVQVLSCFAPFISEEIWKKYLNQKNSIFLSSWPKVDINKIKKLIIKLPIQINGKVRDILELHEEKTQEEILEIIFKSKKIEAYIKDKKIIKIIYIKNKIFNILL